MMRSWPDGLHHIFSGAAGGKDKLSRSHCDAGEHGLTCVALSSAAVVGSLVSLWPCPVCCSLVEKYTRRGFPGICTPPSNAQAMTELSWRKVPTGLEKDMNKQSS